MGLATCRPTGWRVTEGQDPGTEARWVDFESPASDRSTGAGLRYVTASVGPNETGLSGEDFISRMGAALINTHGESLRGWPTSVRVGSTGVVAIQGSYDKTISLVTEFVEITGWEAHFLMGEQHWFVGAVGLAEHRGELQAAHDQFFAGFRLLSP